MTGKELGQQPAYPVDRNGRLPDAWAEGLTKRESFAKAALDTAYRIWMRDPNADDYRGDPSEPRCVAGLAVELADALLDALAGEAT